MSNSGIVRVGISGWTYPPWRGVFFPKKLAHNRELEFASNTFRTIEINGTFYSLQRPSTFQAWADRTPEDFVFSVKASRYVTHMRRLREIEVPLANFFASGILKLGDKLGPILWQFPPNFKYSPALLDDFLRLLPKNTGEAVRLGKQHDARVDGRSFLETDRNRRLRHAIEIRHASFVVPQFIALLRKYKVALVCADAVEWPRLMDVTSDFIYCRLHGSKELYASGYGNKAIEQWAQRVTTWATGGDAKDGDFASTKKAAKRKTRDVYVYFDNDAKVRAPRDAKKLQARIAELLS
ncbi:MAG: DUF72 domain-containing protein [Terriglobia bacterium]|nr:DUF72 domain-containing protein [Terriglobia bacterium]